MPGPECSCLLMCLTTEEHTDPPGPALVRCFLACDGPNKHCFCTPEQRCCHTPVRLNPCRRRTSVTSRAVCGLMATGTHRMNTLYGTFSVYIIRHSVYLSICVRRCWMAQLNWQLVVAGSKAYVAILTGPQRCCSTFTEIPAPVSLFTSCFV